MNEKFETAVHCIKFVAGDGDEAGKTTTVHSCEMSPVIIAQHRRQLLKNKNYHNFGKIITG